MHTKEIMAALVPCGLSCEKCFAHVDGEIRRLSLELREKLGSFESYAPRYVTILGVRKISRVKGDAGLLRLGELPGMPQRAVQAVREVRRSRLLLGERGRLLLRVRRLSL